MMCGRNREGGRVVWERIGEVATPHDWHPVKYVL